MKLKGISVFLMALIMSVAAMAGEQHRKRVEVVVDNDHDSVIHFDSDTAGFDLEDLQLGESRSIIDENGNNLFVVRTEDGFEFDINGRSISIPVIPDTGSLQDIERLHEEHAVDGERHVLRTVSRIVVDTNIDGTDTNDDIEVHNEVHEVHIIVDEFDEPN